MISDSETLVEKSWKQRKGSISFTHNPKNGHGDAHGEDFSRVCLHGYKFCEAFQIKTSDNGATLGLVLPLPHSLPKIVSEKLSAGMLQTIKEHHRKHPHTRCLLFVSKTCKNSTDDEVIRDIWTETRSIFIQLGRLGRQKNRKIHPLVFPRKPCYTPKRM